RAVKMMLKTKRIEYKLSGLHFVKVDEYYERLNSDVREKEIKILKRGKISNLIFYPNNEIYLYKLLDYVGFDLNRLATQSDGGIKMLEPTPNRLEFRPEHGIHLGMFRSKDIASFNLDILNSEAYQYYIQKYKEDIITDEVFINLL